MSTEVVESYMLDPAAYDNMLLNNFQTSRQHVHEIPIGMIHQGTSKTLQISELGKIILVNKRNVLARKRKSTLVPDTDLELSPLNSFHSKQ
jgi:hypothetical protein